MLLNSTVDHRLYSNKYCIFISCCLYSANMFCSAVQSWSLFTVHNPVIHTNFLGSQLIQYGFGRKLEKQDEPTQEDQTDGDLGWN